MIHRGLIIALFSTLPLFTLGSGIMWLFEFEYWHMGHQRTGYIYGDYWVYETDTALFKNPESFRQLLQQHNQEEALTIYHKVNEWSFIIRDKDFPLIPWQVDRNSGLQVPWNEIQGMKYRRLLIKDDYYNFLLTNLHPSDSSWTKEFKLLDTPVGEDVGCRLYVYGKELNAHSKRLIADLAIMYSTDTGTNREPPMKMKVLIDALKREHQIVVVEACGC